MTNKEIIKDWEYYVNKYNLSLDNENYDDLEKAFKEQKSEIIEIVQKEIAESDKYTIAPLQRIMSNLIKEDETN